MTDWNRAKKLMEKLFRSKYLRVCYGQLETPEANCHISYPLTEEETKFLNNYFGGH